MADLCIITTCMGRLEQLRQTLPTMASQPGAECVVVDYSCPDLCGQWVEREYPQVKVVRVPGCTRFHHAHARNAGASAADASWLFFLDSDHALVPTFVERVRPLLKPNTYHHSLPATVLVGPVICPRQAYDKIGGYDEVIVGWGGEDIDFSVRLAAAGLRHVGFPSELMRRVEHSVELCVRYTTEANRDWSNAWNLLYARVKYDLYRITGKWPDAGMSRSIYTAARQRAKEALATGQRGELRIGLGDAQFGSAMSSKRVLCYELSPAAPAKTHPRSPGAPSPKAGDKIP